MNPNLNYKQMSVFGSPDEEAAAIGRSTASYRKAMADDIVGRTGEGPYGTPDTYREVVERGNLSRSDLLALQHRPPQVVSDRPFLHNASGTYNPDDESITVQSPSMGFNSRDTDLGIMAHELGHHLHISNTPPAQRRENTLLDADPVREGVADGFAERVTGFSDREYGDYFNRSDRLDPDSDTDGPSKPMQMYSTSRAAAREGQWPSAEWSEPQRSDQQRLF